MFVRYADDLKRLGAAGVGKPELELERRGKYLLQYIPFEHVNTGAKLVIVGITPGSNQLKLAYNVAQELLQAGRAEYEVLAEIKKAGAFGGSAMRPNLLKMLRHFRFEKILGIEDMETLWTKDAGLLHSTSVVPHAAFKITKSENKMFADNFEEVMKSDLLRECFVDCFVPSIREMNQNAFYVGLGQCPQAALQWCVEEGYLRQEQVLGAFCHPSTNGGSAPGYYLREVSREELSPKDPVRNRCDWLDSAYEQMKANTSSLLGGEYISKITPEPILAKPCIASPSLRKLKQEKPKTCATSKPDPADIDVILAEFEKAGFASKNGTEKLAKFKSHGGQTIYVVKTVSKINNIKVMVHLGLNPEVLRMLEGVDFVDHEHRFHSNMTDFPKRLNNGKTETAYGWQVSINTLGDLSRFLTAFKAVSF